ncbi:biotin synthase BioB [Porphyromonadaceae bacterium W3.11]|nr:biotin synthase BioB [Porphyromonadaceae bacterium W3.11]
MNIADKIIGGYRINDIDELLSIVEQTPREELYEVTHRITRELSGNGFDTCSIINVKSGLCSEDCKWCAQSGHFNTHCETYDALPPEQVLPLAKHNYELGIKRFSLVASGRRPTKKEEEDYVETYERLRGELPNMHLCASLGLAKKETLAALYEAGCTTYHCNMESAPSFFPTLCSTHTQKQKEETLQAASEVGMRRCSGGIIGMGESRRQRAELALYLHSLEIESIPINILHPIPGTPLGNEIPMDFDEVLLSICIFRLANPTAFLRFSGGRAQLTEEVQKKALYIGINSAITGGLLTTTASVTERDMVLFKEMDYDTKKETDWER